MVDDKQGTSHSDGDPNPPSSAERSAAGRCGAHGHSSRCGHHRRGRVVGKLLFLALLVGAVFGVSRAFAGGGHGFGRSCHRGDWTADEAQEKATKAVAWVLSDLDATDEQVSRVQGIAGDTVRDLFALKAEKEALRQQVSLVLTAETVDRARLETLRQQGLRMADTASSRVLSAVLDASDVLDAEQRRALADRLEELHH